MRYITFARRRLEYRRDKYRSERHLSLERSTSRREINIAPWKSRRRAITQPVVHHRTIARRGYICVRCRLYVQDEEEIPNAGRSVYPTRGVGALVNIYVETTLVYHARAHTRARAKSDINYPRNADRGA